jgi:hypothetical protein
MKMATAVSSETLEQLKPEDGNCIVRRNVRIASVLKMANTNTLYTERSTASTYNGDESWKLKLYIHIKMCKGKAIHVTGRGCP